MVHFCSLIPLRGVNQAVQFTYVVVTCYMQVFVCFSHSPPKRIYLFVSLNDSGVRSDRQSSYMDL